MERYKSKFEESSVSISKELTDVIFRSMRFSIKSCEQAYMIYSRICKILGKLPIPASDFIQDTTKESMLKDETWIDMFLNSMLFTLLNVPELEELAKSAIKDKRIRGKIAYAVYSKNPRNLATLIKVLKDIE